MSTLPGFNEALNPSMHHTVDGELKTPDALIYHPPSGFYPATFFDDGSPAQPEGLEYRCMWPSENDAEDSEWKHMFMTNSEDETEASEHITQELPYLKREICKARRRKGIPFPDIMAKMTPALIPEDHDENGVASYFDAAHRIEKNFLASGRHEPCEEEVATLKCLEIYRKAKKQNTAKVEDGVIWISCALYTTAYVERIRVKPSKRPEPEPEPEVDPATVANATLDQE